MQVLIGYSMANFKPLKTVNGNPFPDWSTVLGYILTFLGVIFMLISICYNTLCTKKDDLSIKTVRLHSKCRKNFTKYQHSHH